MRRVEIAGMALGAALVAAGAGAIYWPAGLIVAGVLLILAFADLPTGRA